jgi:hypothetical protein
MHVNEKIMEGAYTNNGAARQMNLQGDATSLNFKKQSIKTESAADRLVFMLYAPPSWKEKVFSSDKERIIVSSEGGESDIALAPSLNFNGAIIFQKCDEKWMIINTGKFKSKYFFDGHERNHFLLAKGEKAVVGTASTPLFIVFFLNGDGKLNRNFSERRPGNDEFSLQKNDSETCFSKDRICLIGRNALCDFNAQGADFSSFIYQKNGDMMIAKLDTKAVMTVDSESVETTAHLTKKSNISIEDTRILFSLSEGDESPVCRMNSGIYKLDAEKLVLVPAGETNSERKPLFLPALGKSVFIGRDAAKSKIVINSDKVSKQHAQAIAYENSLLILDCHSTNGTFVNKEKISKRMVHPGDIIEFGHEKYILSYV